MKFREFFEGNYGGMQGPELGRPVHGKPLNEFAVRIDLARLTQHGLVAGSTGTGKSRAMQLLAEKLGDAGIAVFLNDAKGDASAFCEQGNASEWNAKLGKEFNGKNFPVVYWGAAPLNRLTFSLKETGPVLLARFLSLNSTQEGHLVLAYAFASRKKMPLVGLEDLRAVLKGMVEAEEPGVSNASVNVLYRKIAEMEAKGLGEVFGGSVALEDFLVPGRISVLRQDNPVLSAFFLKKLYDELPEEPKLKLVVFLDEAHLLFKDANKSLVDLVESILRRIRSKGVGVVFLTQDAGDIPVPVLKLLGTKIVFATRVFTQKEVQDLKALQAGFTSSEFYDLRKEFTGMGAGESIVSFLDSTGKALPALKIKWFAPSSAMKAVSAKRMVEENGKTKVSTSSKGKAMQGVVKGAAGLRKGLLGKGGRYFFGFLKEFFGLLGTFVKALLLLLWGFLKWFVKWLLKKPKRIIYLLVLVALTYLAWTHYAEIKQLFDFVFGVVKT